MASVCILDEFNINKNEKFLKIAEELSPVLTGEDVLPKMIFTFPENKPTDLSQLQMGRDDTVVLDFGDYRVGYVTIGLSFAGCHPDAPAYICFRFAERLEELSADPEEYEGWIGKGWIQEEYVHVDVLPARLELPRRYAFRYMMIRVIDVSLKYSLTIGKVSVRTVSAVPYGDAGKVSGCCRKTTDITMEERALLEEIDRISQNTLRNCMQSVFEDGPKRDRRMWLGDLRLQARVNYETFRNYHMAKRCLYLFGGMTFNEGKIAACLFTEPVPEPDDTYLFDYALLYGSALLDYYEATGDEAALRDLYPVAVRQIEIGMSYLDDRGVIPDHSSEFWCFIDWGDSLNTQAASLAVLIYSMKYGIRLARYVGDEERVSRLETDMALLKQNAVRAFWDDGKQLFVSGKDRQVSWATQVWMILAQVLPAEESRSLLLRTIQVNPEIRMITPYMYHHYIDALIRCGEKKLALSEICRYWGGMAKEGADTFWEVYNPDNKDESPYGSPVVNSYCHAWSCTPAYFLRKFY